MLGDVLVGAGSLAAFFTGGWAFLSLNLFKDYDKKDRSIQVASHWGSSDQPP